VKIEFSTDEAVTTRACRSLHTVPERGPRDPKGAIRCRVGYITLRITGWWKCPCVVFRTNEIASSDDAGKLFDEESTFPSTA
jgi:hypothetical protein